VLKFIAGRLLMLIPVLLGVSIVTFIIVRSIPGDPVQVLLGADNRFTPEQIANIRASYGLDQSLPIQYIKWLGHVVQGELGNSLRTKRPIVEELQLRLPVTLELSLIAGLLGTIPALIAGIVAAVKRNSGLDYAATIATLVGVSIPNFLFATLLVLLFSFKLNWLPPIGYRPFSEDPIQNLKTMIMPAVSLALPLAAILMRFTRSSVLEVIGQEHVRTARAKGLRESTVLIRHILPNAGIPILTITGIQIARLLGGTVIVEQIFGLPGVGRYIFESISNRDYPVVQGVTLVMATLFVLVSLVIDVCYAIIDPRLRTDQK
jgi:peptide/nickel transport system permease protein